MELSSSIKIHELKRGVGAETNSGAGAHKINCVPYANQYRCSEGQVLLKGRPKRTCSIHQSKGCVNYSEELGRCKLSAPSDHEQLFG